MGDILRPLFQFLLMYPALYLALRYFERGRLVVRPVALARLVIFSMAVFWCGEMVADRVHVFLWQALD